MKMFLWHLGGGILLAGVLAACTPAQLLPMGGGMMNDGHMGGMMGGGGMGMMSGNLVTGSTAIPTPFGATPVPVDRDIELVTVNSQFSPNKVTVITGETVRWRISNEDIVPHNFYSDKAAVPYLALPAGVTQELVWSAPRVAGTYTALCTLHLGMTLDITVTDR